MFIAQEIIRKKREKQTLGQEEIEFMISGFARGSIPDYQMSALAMAIFLNGFDATETAHLLNAMIASGTHYDWSRYAGKRTFVDKHSTGGVGDKTSLVILPLLVAEGFDVPMISGRGLGHTGGTLDKLESLPGFRTRVDTSQYLRWMDELHGAFGAQTDEFVPADKKLYALRDVTATVESRALITASIMSKKLGEGLDALVLDVKYGSGAFMPKVEDARALAKSMIEAGTAAGCRCVAALTNMDEPLGRSAGNSLEVAECLDILQGKGPTDTKELSLQLAAAVVAVSQSRKDEASIKTIAERMSRHLETGKAFEIFTKIAIAQGARREDIDRSKTSWISGDAKVIALKSSQSGFVKSIATRELGIAILELGGGRKKTDDVINPYVGLSSLKKVGEAISKDEPLCFVHHAPGQDPSATLARLHQAFVITENSKDAKPQPLIKEWIWS